jgi:cellulose synthase/poly-beta-1,6-N-acetylglucosamine synthase-like glycosyltransferase
MQIEWYHIVSVVFAGLQIFFLVFTRHNNLRNLKRGSAALGDYVPEVYLTIPCKGLDTEFEQNVEAFFMLDYDRYHLSFVVESEQDAAYPVLLGLKEKHAASSKPMSVNVSVAGVSEDSCQKTHNMLHSLTLAPESAEVLAFADSDARPLPEWLGYLVTPLRMKEKVGASTGYRWFIPIEGNLQVLFLSILNGKVAQILGKSQFNQAWGGSMAIRKELFYELEIDKVWKYCVSDDLTLSLRVQRAGYQIRYCPTCMVASYEAFSWQRLCDFVYRQLMITRITAPHVWIAGILVSMFSVAGSWGMFVAGIVALFKGDGLNAAIFLAVSVLFFACMSIRAFWRQQQMCCLLSRYADDIRKYSIYDIVFSSVVSLAMLAFLFVSAFGRTITWRGVRYRMISPYKAIRLPAKKKSTHP